MANLKSKFTLLLAIVFFAILMMFEINFDFNENATVESEYIGAITEIQESQKCSNPISIGFVNSFAQDPVEVIDEGDGSDCNAVACTKYKKCSSMGPCKYDITCNGCISCPFKQTDNGGNGRCGS